MEAILRNNDRLIGGVGALCHSVSDGEEMFIASKIEIGIDFRNSLLKNIIEKVQPTAQNNKLFITFSSDNLGENYNC